MTDNPARHGFGDQIPTNSANGRAFWTQVLTVGGPIAVIAIGLAVFLGVTVRNDLRDRHAEHDALAAQLIAMQKTLDAAAAAMNTFAAQSTMRDERVVALLRQFCIMQARQLNDRASLRACAAQ